MPACHCTCNAFPIVWRGSHVANICRDARRGAVWAGQTNGQRMPHPSRGKRKSHVRTRKTVGKMHICSFQHVRLLPPRPNLSTPAVPGRDAGRCAVHDHGPAAARPRHVAPIGQLVLSASPARQIHGRPVRGLHEARSSLSCVQRIDLCKRGTAMGTAAKRGAILSLARRNVCALRWHNDAGCMVPGFESKHACRGADPLRLA